ncbi:Biotin-requiring enzyme [Amycolatopsis xylanica]|uniref:Biotin-requiring enzyme n=1 Tax=Amycolatopsis xylanica TaxID=589385 RepID=A0A1H3E5F3_9PSEU|nr:biotin/lipoyl-binding carrier protein [Amycolatopsis xylanica]SDX73972.1 Biotin-requiring enzyme [Amycolatopsis xylanica]
MLRDIPAEMVGTVIKVVAKPGDVLAEGAMVVILESMKMEIPVLTEYAGTVVELSVGAGDHVQEGAVLAKIEVE